MNCFIFTLMCTINSIVQIPLTKTSQIALLCYSKAFVTGPEYLVLLWDNMDSQDVLSPVCSGALKHPSWGCLWVRRFWKCRSQLCQAWWNSNKKCPQRSNQLSSSLLTPKGETTCSENQGGKNVLLPWLPVGSTGILLSNPTKEWRRSGTRIHFYFYQTCA